MWPRRRRPRRSAALLAGREREATASRGPPVRRSAAARESIGIVTLFTRTGKVSTNDNVEFDNPVNPSNLTRYNPGFPFLATEQGSTGGR